MSDKRLYEKIVNLTGRGPHTIILSFTMKIELFLLKNSYIL